MGLYTWAVIAAKCRRKAGEVMVRKGAVRHPRYSKGFTRSLGLPQGERANWRKELSNGECLHVKEYERYYAVHIDLFHPHSAPLEHLIGDVL